MSKNCRESSRLSKGVSTSSSNFAPGICLPFSTFPTPKSRGRDRYGATFEGTLVERIFKGSWLGAGSSSGKEKQLERQESARVE